MQPLAEDDDAEEAAEVDAFAEDEDAERGMGSQKLWRQSSRNLLQKLDTLRRLRKIVNHDVICFFCNFNHRVSLSTTIEYNFW